MNWYPMVKVAAELGICVNTFKKHYLAKYPPERVFGNRKQWTEATLLFSSIKKGQSAPFLIQN